MGFLTGLITGAAKSVDEQLKKDMQRTQERAEGMAQYRVTRRRAALEAQEKERKEVADVLNRLATFVDGDADRAAQLYVAGGKSVASATKLADELKANLDAGKDISTVLGFTEMADKGQMTDYISQFVTPIKPLPVMEGEMKASGLYGALFKPDMSKGVMRQVEEAAPLPAIADTTVAVPAAKIARDKLIAAEDYKQKMTERDREETLFGMKVKEFNTSQVEALSRMKNADARLELARDQFAETKDVNAWREAQADISNARQDAELDLRTRTAEHSIKKADEAERLNEAKFKRDGDRIEYQKEQDRIANERAAAQLEIQKAAAEREAQLQPGRVEAQKLANEEQRLQNEKSNKAPEFATYESMLVGADQKLLALNAIPDRQRPRGWQDQVDKWTALKETATNGLVTESKRKSTATYTPSFSKSSRDSIINNAITRVLEPAGLATSIEGKIEYKLEGNDIQYFEGMSTVIDNLTNSYGKNSEFNDATMNSEIDNLKSTLNKQVFEYASKQKLAAAKDPTLGADNKPVQFKSNQTIQDLVKAYQAKDKNIRAGDALALAVKDGLIKKGDVVEVGSKLLVFTGSRFVGS